MNPRTLTLALALVMTPAALAAQAIDGSSQESYERSMLQFVQDLDEEEKELFAGALFRLVLDRYPPATGSEGFARLAFIQPAMEAAPRLLDGLTFDELRTEMDAVAQEGRQREEERAMAERRAAEAAAEAERRAEEERAGRQGLERALAEALSAEQGPSRAQGLEACLQEHVAVAGARIEPASFGSTIAFTATNNLDWPISGIRLQLEVVSEGRAVAWDESTHAISVPGGIEPGELRELAFTARLPNSTPDNARVNLTVLDVADAQRRQLVQSSRVIGWGSERSPLQCGEGDDLAEDDVPDPAVASIAEQVAPCWNIGALPSSALAMEIDVRFEVSSEGRPDENSVKLTGYRGGSQDMAQVALHTARRAILICGRDAVDWPQAGPVALSFDRDGVRAAQPQGLEATE